MKQGKLVLAQSATREEVLDTIDNSVVGYMQKKRGLDEAGMRKLINTDGEIFESYMCKVERAIWAFIGAGVPAAFFGK